MIAALPRPVQRRAMDQALLAASLNALCSSLTYGQPIFLLALLYGASDTVMGLLYAAPSAAGLLSLLAPWLLAGLDTSVVQARAWLARAMFALGILGLPLLANNDIKIWTLTILVYLIMMARTIGFLSGASVTKSICPRPELQSFSARLWGRWNAGMLITTIICFVALQPRTWGPDAEWTFMALIAGAVCFHFAAAWAISSIPATGTIAGASPRRTLAAIPVVWRTPEFREVLWLTLFQTPIYLSAGFQLNYLTRILGMPAGEVFLLTLGGVLSSFLMNRILAVIGSKVSTRALWFVLHLVLTMVAMCWCAIEMLPESGRTVVCSVLWVISSAFLSGSTSVHGSMLSERLPSDDPTRVSVIYQLAGVAATLLGLLILLSTDWLLTATAPTWGHAYTHAFLLWAALSVAVCLMSLRMAGGTAAIAMLAQLAPGNLATIWRAHRLRTSETDYSPVGTLELEEVLAARTPAGHDLVMETLRSPDPWHREAAHRAVRSAPFPDACELVMNEVRDVHSPLRNLAVTTLGFLNNPSAIPLLNTLRHDADLLVAATACKSLARLGQPQDDADILHRYATYQDPRERSELLIALAVAKRDATLMGILSEEMTHGSSRTWLESIALYVAQVRGGREDLCILLAAEHDRAGAGLDEAMVSLGEQLTAGELDRIRSHIAAGNLLAACASTGLPAANHAQLAIALMLQALKLASAKPHPD